MEKKKASKQEKELLQGLLSGNLPEGAMDAEIEKIVHEALAALLGMVYAFNQTDMGKYYQELCQRYDMKKLFPYIEADADMQKAVKDGLTFGELLADKERYRAILERAAKAFEKSGFDVVRTGKEVNAFTKTTIKRQTKKDGDRLLVFLPKNMAEMFVSLTDFEAIRGLRVSAFQLLDMLTASYIDGRRDAKGVFTEIGIDEYMAKRGLKDRKTAIQTIKEDLETLRHTDLMVQKEPGSKTYYKVAIVGDRGIYEERKIQVTFGSIFSEWLTLRYKPMLYPKLLYRLNSKRNPHSFYLLRRISEHKSMNFYKDNADVISVKALLEACPDFPSYESVLLNQRGHVGTKIILPFERDMDSLSDVLTWEYRKDRGDLLTAKEAENMDYKLFESLMVRVYWKSYPERKPKNEGKLEGKKRKSGGNRV